MRAGFHRRPAAGWTGMAAMVAFIRARRVPVVMVSHRCQTDPPAAAELARGRGMAGAGQVSGQLVHDGDDLVPGGAPLLAGDLSGAPTPDPPIGVLSPLAPQSRVSGHNWGYTRSLPFPVRFDLLVGEDRDMPQRGLGL